MTTTREKWICVTKGMHIQAISEWFRLVFSIVAHSYLCIACVSFVRTHFTSIKIISFLNALFYLRAHINWSCIRTRIRKHVNTLYRSNGHRSTQKIYKPIWISSKSFVSFYLSLPLFEMLNTNQFSFQRGKFTFYQMENQPESYQTYPFRSTEKPQQTNGKWNRLR